MLWGASRARVFIYPEPCDMRKSFAGLCGIVRNQLNSDPLGGHYYFFMNRSKNYLKILCWDGTGYCIAAKKLPKGSFENPVSRELLLQELLTQLEPSKRIKNKLKHIA